MESVKLSTGSHACGDLFAPNSAWGHKISSTSILALGIPERPQRSTSPYH